LTTAEGPPAVDPKLRPFLMGLALVLGAVTFLVARSSGFGTALFAGVGMLALGIAASDTLTARPADRSQLLTWGMTLLGVGLLGLSLYVAVR
jgi:hypothetical protein